MRPKDPAGVQFLLGSAPDHLFDLVSDLCKSIGAPAPIRFGALGMFEARVTLGEAARAVFGRPDTLFFDLANADLVISFGANFLVTSVAPTRAATPGNAPGSARAAFWSANLSRA